MSVTKPNICSLHCKYFRTHKIADNFPVLSKTVYIIESDPSQSQHFRAFHATEYNSVTTFVYYFREKLVMLVQLDSPVPLVTLEMQEHQEAREKKDHEELM